MSRLLVPAVAGLLLLSACSAPGVPGASGGGVSLDGFPPGVAEMLIEGTATSQSFWDDASSYGWIYLTPASGADSAGLAVEVADAFDAAGAVVVDNLAPDSEFAPGVPFVPTRVGDGFIITAWGGEASTTAEGRDGVSYNVAATALPASAFTEHDDLLMAIAPLTSLDSYGDYWSRQYVAHHPDAVESDCNALLLEADAALRAGGLPPDEEIDPTWLGAYDTYSYGDVDLSCQEPWGALTGEPGWLVSFTVEVPAA